MKNSKVNTTVDVKVTLDVGKVLNAVARVIICILVSQCF